MAHVKAGFGVSDDPPPARVLMQDGQISRRMWDTLSQSEQRATIRAGVRIVDFEPLGEAEA